MEFLRDLSEGLDPCVVAVGSFDGVHLGHREILRRLRERADVLGVAATVLTFEPHPLQVLTDTPPPLLTLLEEKATLMDGTGVDRLVALPFDRQLAELSPQAFVLDVLAKGLAAREVLVGYNFTFGAGGAGTADTLCRMGEAAGLRVHVVPPQESGGRVISSTLVREHLLQGEVEAAAQLLGRPFVVRGRVVAGDGRGRNLGFPTANLEVATEKLLPARGVYAIRAKVDGEERPAVVNIGRRPTFHGRDVTVEVHIMDFAGDLYGTELSVEFLHYLRGEQAFASVDDLMEQIRRDVAQARELLAVRKVPAAGFVHTSSDEPRSG